MECPTCFQKIIAPQAPATDDPKFIITGTKVGAERPLPAAVTNGDVPPAPVPEQNSFVPAVIFVGLFCLAVVLLFVFHGRIFKSAGETVSTTTTSNQIAARPPAPPKPAVVAPPADDALWKLNLDGAATPDTPAAGRIHGQDFIVEHAIYQNGMLILRAGSRGPMEFGFALNFHEAPIDALVAQTINVTTNTDQAARVIVRWSNDENSGRVTFDGGYAMRLEFGVQEGNRLPGKIYLCTPDAEKSYLAGTFSTEVRRSRPPRRP